LAVPAAAKEIRQARVIGWGVALLEGICLMHKKVHRLHLDIKPENLFIDDELRIKLGDFGISQLYVLGDDESLGVPVRYDTQQNFVAPEQICPNKLSRCGSATDCPHGACASAATDKWQVGLVLLQLLTRKTIQQLIDSSLPYPLPNLTTLTRANFEALLIQHAGDTDTDLKSLVLDLLGHDASKRPLDQQAVDTIRAIRDRWCRDLNIGR